MKHSSGAEWLFVEGASTERLHYPHGPGITPDRVIGGARIERLADTNYFRVVSGTIRIPWNRYRDSADDAIVNEKAGSPMTYPEARDEFERHLACITADRSWHLVR